MADHLRKYEALFTCKSVTSQHLPNMSVTPQRMRMIVHAFEDTLDRGLKKDGQTVPMSMSLLNTPCC